MLLASVSFGQSSPRELVLLNWSEYMDPELIEDFERLYKVKVREIYFESDDLRDEMLLESGGMGYDLAIVNGAMIGTYQKRGWLQPVTEKQIPNMRLIDDYWLKAFNGTEGYAVPYFWGTLGIGYRADLLETPPVSWMDLFKPSAQVRGKIAMIESQRDAMGMALKALGYSVNSTDRRQIREATELLLAQRPYVKPYTYLVLDENSALVTGDIVMAMMFNGDVLMLKNGLDIGRVGGDVRHHDEDVFRVQAVILLQHG